LLPAESVLMRADLTADNILVQDGRLAGFIDLADAFVAPVWTTGGDRRFDRAVRDERLRPGAWAECTRSETSRRVRCAARESNPEPNGCIGLRVARNHPLSPRRTGY
jgi:hypothetical protein